jgi:hypothetical protein
MEKFVELTKQMQVVSKPVQRQPVDHSSFIHQFRNLSQMTRRYETMMSRTVAKLSMDMGPVGRLFLSNLNVDSILSRIPQAMLSSEVVMIGRFVVGGVVGGIAGIFAVAIAAVIKKTFEVMPAAVRDYWAAMALGTTVGGLRAFELTFGRFGLNLRAMIPKCYKR